jgi:hypothetical protein
MPYNILTLNDKLVWSKYLEYLPIDQQDIYYTPEYYELYEKNGDGRAMCFVFEKHNNIALYPFLINSVNDLGYELDDEYFDIQGAYGYNGVVSSSYHLSFIKEFYNTFDQYCLVHNIIADFVRYHPLINNQEFSRNNVKIQKNRQTVLIKLDNGKNQIEKNFRKSVLRNIKKAEHSGLSYEISDNNDVDDFITIYHHTMDRLNSDKYLYFSREYFRYLFKMSSVITINVKYHDETIASAVCFKYKNYFHYHLGASYTEYLSFRPNDLMFYAMIQTGLSNDCNYLHLGGGNSSLFDDGLLRFKKNFSKDTSNYYVSKKVYNDNVYNSVCDIWKKKNPDQVQEFINYFLKYRIV